MNTVKEVFGNLDKDLEQLEYHLPPNISDVRSYYIKGLKDALLLVKNRMTGHNLSGTIQLALSEAELEDLIGEIDGEISSR